MRWSFSTVPAVETCPAIVHMLPGESLSQEICILADLVHQCVVVSLHSQSLVENILRHRRGEEREWSISHQLENKSKKTKVPSSIAAIKYQANKSTAHWHAWNENKHLN